MMGKRSRQTILMGLIFIVFSACAGGKAVVTEIAGEEMRESPRLIVKSSQEAVYNGKPQPISFQYAGDEEPDIIYYPSVEARKENRGGSSAAPVRAGTYFVRVRYPGGNEHPVPEEALAEYRIIRSPVKIETGEIQRAFYNGNPKRVQAETVPPVPLSYSYYPNRQLRETAQKAARESAVKNSGPPPTRSYKGYRRVERAPIEPGTYYVWICFPGDENHEPAHANVEFTILPAIQ